ncbi:DUF1189 domain-containing protein [Neobacillus niacini]|uniref:DUF1189 domain-containing protein n=1 Tax=Neobacillus niacini TaxID=86668 RepID=UPI00052FD1AE|nr:DUF1189 domain-containing protein [Neobacillus niacini]KGM45306.1 membrane protein [Neobacillus niacini]MEC1522958.1 DUF1189 domain-containing protein [Neobacillus niacini]
MNIFKQFYKSTYSPKDIASFRFQGIGKTILFVFFLTFLSILPSIYYINTMLNEGIDSTKSVINNDIPSFTIDNGTLSAETDVPITVDKGEFSIIVDPTGVITNEDVEDKGNAIALLKNEITVAAGGRVDSYSYSMMEGLTITKADFIDIVDTVDGLKGIIIPAISLFMFLISSAVNFIEVSILAWIGLLLKNLAGRSISYRHLWRMAAYSATLPTVFFTIMSALNTPVPNSFYINWFVEVIILFLAIKEIQNEKTNLES